ncbi:hypothetical protein COP1_022994 [Malus domestica]
MAWNGTLSTTGEAVFDKFYWEWLEDVLSRFKDVLTKVGLYHAVIGGLSIHGKFYDEVVPSAEELSLCNSQGLPASCRYLFWVYHKLFQDAQGDVNLVRPGVFKIASKMAAGESFSLAIPVLANIYNGLSIVSNSTNTEDRAAVLPYHYVYGWLGEYFSTHFSLTTLDKSMHSLSTAAKMRPLMTKYSGVLSAKSLDDL